MKGVIFHVVEQVVIAEHGEDTWDLLLERAGASGVYTTLGTYDDAELGAIVHAAADALGETAADVLHWVGVRAFPHLARAHPQLVAHHGTARALFLGLNRIIHPEVRKLYPDSVVPHFHFEAGADGTLHMTYESPRGLCHLASGLAAGAAAHFGETLGTTHLTCQHRGDARCTIALDFRDAVSVSREMARPAA
jgi:hypothetical protein